MDQEGSQRPTMSKARVYLESKGWRLWSRRKFGMFIKEQWFHPDDGTVVLNQGEALREQRRRDRAKRQKAR